MNQLLKMILVLTVLGLISGLVLSLVSDYATPIINENKQEATEDAIYYVLPDTERYETVTYDEKDIYKSLNGDDKLTGYAFTASGSGYQGTIRLMVGVGPDLNKIKGIQILESSETPGLGGKIRGDNFKDQFRGLVASGNLSLVKGSPKNPGEVEAITGATISSRAVVNTINQELDRVEQFLSSGA